MTGSANDATLGKHLESLATAMKQYTLAELLQVTQAVAADLAAISVSGGGSGVSYSDFTGATSIAGGASGLVPEPHPGDQDKFLRGDGSWATVSSGSPAVSDGNVLSTVASTVDGGFWFDASGNVPVVKFHYGNFDYSLGLGSTTYVGSNPNLVSYLPLDFNVIQDACGNEWIIYGSPILRQDTNALSGKSLYLNGSSYIDNFTIVDAVGSSSWTIDFWATAGDNSTGMIFGTYNTVYATNEAGLTNYCVFLYRRSESSVTLGFFNNDTDYSCNAPAGTRHHYALTYNGAVVRFFFDGGFVGERTHDITLGLKLRIGAAPYGGYNYTGTIERFRVSTAVRWTSDFTPPTAADYA